MWSIFEKFSSTSETKKSKVFPIRVKSNSYVIYDTLIDYLNKEQFYNVRGNRDVFDIFCMDNGYEISFLIGQEPGGGCCINITIYGPHKRGLTRKKLLKIREEISNLFKQHLF